MLSVPVSSSHSLDRLGEVENVLEELEKTEVGEGKDRNWELGVPLVVLFSSS